MKFFIGTDHAGFALKASVLVCLQTLGHETIDLGPHSTDRVDYPDYAKIVCQAVLENEGSFGILICGTGIGMSMSANKFKGIRAGLCTDAYTASMTRAHNDANVLCMGERVVGPGVAESIVRAFCTTDFEGGRHACRVGKIEL